MRRIAPMLGFAMWLACPAAAQDPGEPRPRDEPGRLADDAAAALLTPRPGSQLAPPPTRLADDAAAALLTQARTAAFELGMQSETVPRQRSLTRMMTGLGLVVGGARLLWYRFEDKDCREPDGARCAWVAGAGAAGLGAGALLMTVLARTPAAQSVHFEPRPGGAAVRVDLLGSSSIPNKWRQ